METSPSVSSDVNSVRGNKTERQMAQKHNLQAHCKVKQRQTTVFVSQGNVPIAGWRSSSSPAPDAPTNVFLSYVSSSCRDGLTSLSQKQNGEVRAGPTQENVPRVQLCNDFRFLFILRHEVSPALKFPSLPASPGNLTYRSTQLLNGKQEATQNQTQHLQPTFQYKIFADAESLCQNNLTD